MGKCVADMSADELAVERRRKRDYMRRVAANRTPEEWAARRAEGRAQYTPRPRATEIQRFWAKVGKGDTPGACWMWRGSLASSGYGRLLTKTRYALAHRYSYELHNGPVPAELVIDHTCRNRGCVNPAHLEPVTTRENVLRGVGITAVHAVKDRCPKCGADYSFAKKGRYCKPCRYSQIKEWQLRHPDKHREHVRKSAAKRRALVLRLKQRQAA